MVYAQTIIRPGEWDEKYSLGFRRSDLVIIDMKKRNCRIVGFAATADDRVKIKENEKRDQYLDFAR